jgi:hypothetical protein
MWTAVLIYEDWESETFGCENKSWADYWIRRRYEKWRRIVVQAYYATKDNEINPKKIIDKYIEEEQEQQEEENERREKAELERLKYKYK